MEIMAMEMQKVDAWIQQERPQYWTREVRRGFDKIAETRVALNRCEMRTVAGQRSACIEEKQAFAAAKRRLELCQEQIKNVRRWAMKLGHEENEFRGRLSGLRRCVESDLPKAIALLEQTATVLEAYAELPPPETEG
ncbi:MAG: hypothetical protein KDA58_14805, partial [Planctomycetaceae bacterium]|nr:hypothetical protein [Planctomycetaceae bacterium]